MLRIKGKGTGKVIRGRDRGDGDVGRGKGGGLIEYIQTCFPREPYLLIGEGSMGVGSRE